MYYNLKESGLRIQKLRKQSGMTQEQLAAKMNTSISNLGKLERGLQGLSIDLLINLALFFHVSLDYIILGKELQVDTIKTALRSMVDTLMNLEQKL